jgi:hypothetical protein
LEPAKGDPLAHAPEYTRAAQAATRAKRGLYQLC